MVLGQTKVEGKSNEITAIPELLEILDLVGCIITIDAMGTQTDIAEKNTDKKVDYILALKGNQGALKEEVESIFWVQKPVEEDHVLEKNRGRIESRKCEVIRRIS